MVETGSGHPEPTKSSRYAQSRDLVVGHRVLVALFEALFASVIRLVAVRIRLFGRGDRPPSTTREVRTAPRARPVPRLTGPGRRSTGDGVVDSLTGALLGVLTGAASSPQAVGPANSAASFSRSGARSRGSASSQERRAESDTGRYPSSVWPSIARPIFRRVSVGVKTFRYPSRGAATSSREAPRPARVARGCSL